MNQILPSRPNNKIFFHLHVPKTAGSSLREILKKNFKDAYKIDSPLISYHKFSRDDIEALLYLYPYNCYSSHNYGLEELMSFEQISAFSLVRNPIEKTISSYFYLRNRKMTSEWHICKTMKLGEVINYLDNHRIYHPFLLDSSQTEWITGKMNDPLNYIEEAIKKGRYNIFPTDKFDEMCVILEKMYPDNFLDCSYQKSINTSRKDYKISDEELDQIEKLPWVQEDLRLYNLALKNLEELKKKYFSSDKEFYFDLENFKERCQPKTQKPKALNKSLYKKVLKKIGLK